MKNVLQDLGESLQDATSSAAQPRSGPVHSNTDEAKTYSFIYQGRNKLLNTFISQVNVLELAIG